MNKLLALSLAVAALLLHTEARAQVVVSRVDVTEDGTAFSNYPDNSGGGSLELYAGNTRDGYRNAMLRFQLPAGIPAGSIVTSAKVHVYINIGFPGPTLNLGEAAHSSALHLFRLTESWTEGVDSAGGQGLAATVGGMTWNSRSTGILGGWATPGGSYSGSSAGSVVTPGAAPAASTELIIVGNGTMLSDIAGWVSSPGTNFGWVFRDPQAITGTAGAPDATQFTARPFASKEGAAGTRPFLEFTYFKPNGVSCSPGECASGNCVNGVCCQASACPLQTECQSSAPQCQLGTGTCSNPAFPFGTACSADANPCSRDICNGGVCTHDTPGNAGAACASDGNPCTVDQCSGGSLSCVYTPGNPGAPCAADTDPCTLDQCNGSSPTCQHPGGNNGAVCTDGNSCTQTDACSGGSCVGGNPKICAPLDECHIAGTCNPLNGTCSTPAKADGAGCSSDGNPCTVDQCIGGACSHTSPSTAGTACPDDGNVCTNDQCNGSSTACQHPPLSGGTPCAADTNPCTLDECNGAGTCAHPAGNAGAQCSGPSCACPGGSVLRYARRDVHRNLPRLPRRGPRELQRSSLLG